jgi:outer membrane protein assembly factor BamB
MKRLTLLALMVLGMGLSAGRAEDWPQWLGARRDSVWRETGLLERFPEGGPKVIWRVKVAAGYAGPAVAGGRVYLTDFVTKDDLSNHIGRSRIDGTERVLCYRSSDGELLWKHEYPCRYHISYPGGPRCTPTVAGGKVYTLGAMGDLLCLDADKGAVLWSRDLRKDYRTEAPLWGFSSHPLVDGQNLYCVVGGRGSVAVAFDKDSGKEVWRALTASEPGYSPPTMIEAGGVKQLLIWHADSLDSLDPKTGKVHWSVELSPSYGMAITAPRQLGDYLYAGAMGRQAVLLKLASDKPAVKEVWRGDGSTGVFGSNSTPFLEDGMIYGVCCEQGALRGVKLSTGERLWADYDVTTGGRRVNHGTAFLVKYGDRFFLFNETGRLIIARLTSTGCEEISRARLLEPTNSAFGRDVVWSHPAFAEKCIFARNDRELICVSLAAEKK